MRVQSKIRALALALAAVAGAVAAPLAGQGGDRQLLRTGGGDPYVFIMLDTSGSMNWASECTQDMIDEGKCSFLCNDADCATPRNGDDPASKMRQAKEALYEVLYQITNVNYGFASYNQDLLRVEDKHWLYEVVPGQVGIPLAGGVQFPAAGAQEVFGATVACDRCVAGTDNTDGGNGRCFFGGPTVAFDDHEVGCYGDLDAADLDDAWEVEKVRRLPKLGRAFDQTVTVFVRSGGVRYRVRYQKAAASLAPPAPLVLVDVNVGQCNNAGCTSVTDLGTAATSYSLIGDFVFWDNGVNRAERQRGWFGQTFSKADATCRGWDPNAEPGTNFYVDSDGILDGSNLDIDPFNSYSLKQATITPGYFDPPGTENDWRFWEGDVLPLNWTSDNKTKILNRLAPALNGGPPLGNPNAFRQASYLVDARAGSDQFLRLSNPVQRPLFANGSTPLAGMMTFFRYWYSGCGGPGNCTGEGWSDIAAANDVDWECRKKYLIILTDGEESCDSAPGNADYYRQNPDEFPPGFAATTDACRYVASMQSQEDIQSFVIAFGARESPKINCLSSKSDPFYVDTKQELVDTLLRIFAIVREEAVAFASAAVPTVQANIADKVYLSSFTPLNFESVWPGRLDAFLKPLPLDPSTNLPDRTRLCVPGSVESECFAYDASDAQPAFNGEAGYAPRGLLLQAPFESDFSGFDETKLQVGPGADQRRVFFGLPDADQSTVGGRGKRQLFVYPADAASQAEFEFVWNLPNPGVGDLANKAEIKRVIDFTLKEKQGEITNPDDPDNPFHIQYVMGDIFHASPGILNAPGDFDLFTQDLYWHRGLCGASVEATRSSRGNRISYAWFANRHLCRRVMLFVGSDDGQLHVFDGGTFEGTECKLDLPADMDARDAQLGDNDSIDGDYNFGTGREIFSFIPAAQMPLIRELASVSALTTQYGVDGTPRVTDVFIDPIRDAAGAPSCTDREWRTVLIGSYREGGPGLFALDITQPDIIPTGTNLPTPLAGSPAYVPSCIATGAGDTGCAQTGGGAAVPFPTLLWEFTDTSDEDASGTPDLAESWSRPVVARIQVCDGACDELDEPEDRFVAIFGGGITDAPANSSADTSGNWLYMVDVETGAILYKRGGVGSESIVGSIAADVTVVDRNVNGLVDTLYFGTTAGYVYKLALGEGPFELGLDGRIQDPAGDDRRYDAFQVFSTGGKPIYLEISAVYVPKLRANALVFGTGNRWNLWDFGNVPGRFYAIVDDEWADELDPKGLIDPVGCGSCTEPLTEASFQEIDPDAAFDITNPNPDFLFGNPLDVNKLPGWFFTLGLNEKLITEPFSLAGITFFTVFDPVSTIAEEDGDPVCAKGGESKIFTVNTANAIGYSIPPGTTDFARYVVAPQFTTQPFAESGASQNPPGEPTGSNADQWTDELRMVNAELKKLFPAPCRFANYTIDIKTIRSDTGLVFIAPVPVCIEGHNWKEF